MKIRELGEYIRNQRKGARLSLKSVSTVAGVSIPYLSQIERGLRKPSAEILQAIAKGLRISAETLYVQAGFLEDRPVTDVVGAVMSDPALTERHKEALVEIYRAFREETGRVPVPTEGSGPDTPKTSKRSPRGSGRTSSGRTGARAVPSPHRPPRRPTATDAEKEV
jgi:transcriptional regulator with XRE-family HTH domain